ncbi:zinc-ribbon domain-containing protein [Kribbella sp. NPDC051587]|uniref:zinc-ribbon domain-containing protein n=1 Tax=Kribbella sp. NPDC051587 TaxID=3364119 RepID=UPI003793902D
MTNKTGVPGRARSGWLSDHRLAAEFDYAANHPLTPDQVAEQSNIAVNWVCESGHRWTASPNNRVGKTSGCPDCGGYRVNDANRLSMNCPDKFLLEQWDYVRNTTTPNDYSVGSSKKVWWTCPAADDHSWLATIDKRVSGRKCPFCSGRRVSSTNRLAIHRPDIASQLDEAKSGFTADDVSIASMREGIWNCPVNDRHPAWPAPVGRRTGGWSRSGAGCPSCHLPHTSVQELRLKAELATVLPIDHTRSTLPDADGRMVKVDIVVDDNPRGLHLVLEFDGVWWHRSPISQRRDAAKADRLRRAGWTVVRVREADLEPLDPAFDLVIAPQLLPEEAATEVLNHLVTLGLLDSVEAAVYHADNLPRAEATADAWILAQLGEPALSDDRRSQENLWDRMFTALSTFELEHGHCRVPKEVFVEEVNLARWIAKQRGRHRDGQLPLTRQDRLISLSSWTFSPQETEFARQRDAYIASLKNRTRADAASREQLKTWAENLRTRRRRLREQGRDLPGEQLDQIGAIPGWEWDPRSAGFDRKIQILQSALTETNKTIDQIRQRDRWKDSPIGTWLNTWRTRPDRLSIDQRQFLESLPGWTWNARDDIWQTRFTMLQDFGEGAGHLHPSLTATEEDERVLARWKRNNKNRLQGSRGTKAHQFRTLLAQYGEELP